MAAPQLTKCELEVMDIVWQLGRATVREVCQALDRPLAYTTVMTTLRILEEKRGAVRSSKQSRAHVYTPTVSREEVCRAVAGELRCHLFKGNVKSLVLNLLGSEPLTRVDIEELKSIINSLEPQE